MRLDLDTEPQPPRFPRRTISAHLKMPNLPRSSVASLLRLVVLIHPMGSITTGRPSRGQEPEACRSVGHKAALHGQVGSDQLALHRLALAGHRACQAVPVPSKCSKASEPWVELGPAVLFLDWGGPNQLGRDHESWTHFESSPWWRRAKGKTLETRS